MKVEPVTATRYFALFSGLCLGLLGLLGIIHAGVTPMHWPMEYGNLRIRIEDGFLLGLFPSNVFFDVLLVGFGFLGCAAYASGGAASIGFSRAAGAFFLILTVLALIPSTQTRTVWGFMPIYGADVWLNGSMAFMGLVFGYTAAGDVTDVPATDRTVANADLFHSKHGSI